MRKVALICLALLAVALAADDESLDALKARADAANGSKRIELSVDVARRELESANMLWDSAEQAKAQAALEDSVKYAEIASKSAISEKRRLKQTEIALRKLVERMKELKRTLSFEDRAPIDPAIQKIEQARTNLLDEMFKK